MNLLSPRVETFLIQVEDKRLTAYKDSGGIWTIAIGLAHNYPDGTPIKAGDTCSSEQALEWLRGHLNAHVYPKADKLRTMFQFNDDVYVAICSFIYNEGENAIATSKSILLALASRDLDALAKAFLLYNKVRKNGELVFNQGVENRRLAEIHLFNKDFKKENIKNGN